MPVFTRYGPLDLLGAIGRDLGYRDLVPHSVEMDNGAGVRVRVLDPKALIAVKEELTREKPPFPNGHGSVCRCCFTEP